MVYRLYYISMVYRLYFISMSDPTVLARLIAIMIIQGNTWSQLKWSKLFLLTSQASNRKEILPSQFNGESLDRWKNLITFIRM